MFLQVSLYISLRIYILIAKTSSSLENLFSAHWSFRENIRLSRKTSWSALSLIDSIVTGIIYIYYSKKVLHHLIFTTFLSNVLYKYTRNIF